MWIQPIGVSSSEYNVLQWKWGIDKCCLASRHDLDYWVLEFSMVCREASYTIWELLKIMIGPIWDICDPLTQVCCILEPYHYSLPNVSEKKEDDVNAICWQYDAKTWSTYHCRNSPILSATCANTPTPSCQLGKRVMHDHTLSQQPIQAYKGDRPWMRTSPIIKVVFFQRNYFIFSSLVTLNSVF